MQAPVILLANGNYPNHPIPLKKIHTAGSIICCDGAVNKLSEEGYTPHIIIGDLDSIEAKYKKKYHDKLYHIVDQNENDLRKAIKWINSQKIEHVTILGATGKREDHTLGNIFTFLQFPINFNCRIITNFGTFTLIKGAMELKSFKGEKISLFSINSKIKISSDGLKYNFNKYTINTLYSCTLNESIESVIKLNISHGRILAYQVFDKNKHE